MICWWCSNRLTNPFKKEVEGVEVELPWCNPIQKVRVHKVCEKATRNYITKFTAVPPGEENGPNKI